MCEFDNTNYRGVEGAAELIRSLGWKVSIHERRVTLDGRDMGSRWTVQFTVRGRRGVTATVARSMFPLMRRSRVVCILVLAAIGLLAGAADANLRK
ncbi:MAG: hypothetical protein ACR2NB_09770, partial [Solirubrobacteraceae bacterium]